MAKVMSWNLQTTKY